jgi:acetoin utilization deacetylase AcuC-like enzyme
MRRWQSQFQETTMETGYVYHPIYLEHDRPSHPENARRLRRILDVLGERGVLDRLQRLEPRPATEAELLRVHTAEHVERVREVAEKGGGNLDPDTYVSARSFDAALMAAGGVVKGVEGVLDGEIANGFALVRPPGHHAKAGRAMGFCLFNNVAIAARAALAREDIERVFIADFDVHHGNGTADLFASDPDVFYFSTHQYPYYPGTGAKEDVGMGAGAGTTLNVPLPTNVGDGGYARIFESLVWPLTERFDPDLILVSAGYDGHWDDPLAYMSLSLTGYADMAQALVRMADRLCGGRVIFTLEGGYQLDALAYGVLNAFYALLGEETVVDPLGPSPSPERSIDSLIEDLKKLHRLD